MSICGHLLPASRLPLSLVSRDMWTALGREGESHRRLNKTKSWELLPSSRARRPGAANCLLFDPPRGHRV